MLKKNIYFSNLFFSIGSSLLIFLFSIFTTTLVYFLFNKTINFSIIIVSTLTTLVYILYISNFLFKNTYKHNSFLILFVLICFFVISYILSGKFLDLSFDGQSYHQEAIIQLANGWNPLKHSIKPDVWDHTYAIWLNHFPKFSWICWAVFYSTFGDIENGKILNFLLMFSCFCLVFAVLSYRNKNYFKNLILSGIISLNPIFLYQFWSFYLDNQIASLIYIFIFLVYFSFISKNNVIYFLISIVTICLINTKLTLIAYLPVIYLFSLFISFLLKRVDVFKKILLTGLISGFLSICVFGFHPYITTFIEYKNPFYPMLNFFPIKDASDKQKFVNVVPALPHVTNIREFIYESNMPKNFIGRSSFEKIFLSIFSKSSNLVPYTENGKEILNETTELKIPFSLYKSEILPFNTTDVRISGFGPWFSGAILLSLVTLFLLFFYEKKVFLIVFLVNMALFLSSMVNSESWWARYVPQLWLIPISIVVACRLVRSKVLSFFSYLIVFVLIGNLFFISFRSVKNQYYSSELRKIYFNSLSQEYKTLNLPVFVDLNSFRANRILYKQSNIPYIEKSIEIGAFENHIMNKISKDDKEYLLNYYKKDMSAYKYNLDIKDLSNSDIVKISKTINSVDLLLTTD